MQISAFQLGQLGTNKRLQSDDQTDQTTYLLKRFTNSFGDYSVKQNKEMHRPAGATSAAY